MPYTTFLSTSRRLNHDLHGMRLYEKANLLSHLVEKYPEEWTILDEQMNSLFPLAIGVIGDAFACYDVVSFGLVEDDFVEYATSQFTRRFERLERARSASLDEVNRIARETEDA